MNYDKLERELKDALHESFVAWHAARDAKKAHAKNSAELYQVAVMAKAKWQRLNKVTAY